MNRSEEIKKLNERAVVDHFFTWLAQHGGLEFAFSHLPEGEIPDLAYQAAEVELYVEHTSAHYGPEHRKFINGPVRGDKNPAECLIGIGNIDELLGDSIVEAVQGKCDRMAYGPNTLLLVEALPGLTTADGLAEILRERSFPPAMPFIGVYVVGRFPYVGKSVGGFRVVPIKHSYLTLELPKKDDACLSTEMCEADKEAAYTEGYKEATLRPRGCIKS